MALFESYERRIDQINKVIAEYGFKSVEECKEYCASLKTPDGHIPSVLPSL